MWVDGSPAWEAKSIWIESAHRLFECGRICSEASCTATSVMAFPVLRDGCKWDAGFCGAHVLVFAMMDHDGYTVGEPRRLEDDEPLSGPMLPGEDQDEGDDPIP